MLMAIKELPVRYRMDFKLRQVVLVRQNTGTCANLAYHPRQAELW